MNNIMIEGNVTRDPEMRFTPNGVPVTSFSVAVNRRWQDKNGEWREEVTFFNVQSWQRLAENIAECLSKGDRIVVIGQMREESWEGKDGVARRKSYILAQTVATSINYATVNITKNEKYEGTETRKQEEPEPEPEPEDDEIPF